MLREYDEKKKIKYYNYCSTARTFEDMCGRDGKKFKERSKNFFDKIENYEHDEDDKIEGNDNQTWKKFLKKYFL